MKNLTRLIAIVLFISSFNFITAQVFKNEKDPFTGEKVVSADYYRQVYIVNKGGKTKFEVQWSYPGSLNTVISKGAEILFKMKDGEIIKLTTVSDAQPKIGAGYGTILTSYVFEMELEKVTLNKFSLVKIDMMRVPDLKAGSTDLDKKMPYGKIYFKFIMKGAKYLMKNI
jgi:hypothetical protein